MPSEIIEVEGIEEACQALDQVSRIVSTRGYTNGLAAAGDVFRAELLPRIPYNALAVANKAHGGKGALRVRVVRDVQVDAQGRGGVVEVGFGPLGHIANWVEWGHQIVDRGAMRKKVKGKWEATLQSVSGFVPPHPFMRPAFDAAQAKAIDAFVEAVKETLSQSTPGYEDAA